MAGFKPFGDRILVRRTEIEEKSPGGIVIPDVAKEKPIEATVVAIGPGRMLDDGSRASTQTRVGMRVLIGKYSGTEIKLEGVEHVVVREEEILGERT